MYVIGGLVCPATPIGRGMHMQRKPISDADRKYGEICVEHGGARVAMLQLSATLRTMLVLVLPAAVAMTSQSAAAQGSGTRSAFPLQILVGTAESLPF